MLTEYYFAVRYGDIIILLYHEDMMSVWELLFKNSQKEKAWKLVTGLPMFWLINLICLVLVWTSYTLLSAAKKDKAKGIA